MQKKKFEEVKVARRYQWEEYIERKKREGGNEKCKRNSERGVNNGKWYSEENRK